MAKKLHSTLRSAGRARGGHRRQTRDALPEPVTGNRDQWPCLTVRIWRDALEVDTTEEMP